eukprot:TRINITY_DN10558_c0_g3_i1.p1 TRINITY_DN10558_c0_g3~~TRINITY_DN10558_c0_g3_i1.p1  ORF type:complete len:366 (+),score=82.06 TRINITY_DN10558_c0_g3_i1:55-1152(+)
MAAPVSSSSARYVPFAHHGASTSESRARTHLMSGCEYAGRTMCLNHGAGLHVSCLQSLHPAEGSHGVELWSASSLKEKQHWEWGSYIRDDDAVLSSNEAFQSDAARQHKNRREAIAWILLSATAWALVPVEEAAGAAAAAVDAVDPSLASEAIDDGGMFQCQKDDINAYEYKYPVTASKLPNRFFWVESRKPERYSSAAPLSPDGRQRIVSERLDLKNNLVLSVSVGPPNAAFIRTRSSDRWEVLDVARSVLADKSTARMTPEQRVQETIITDIRKEEKGGQTYWYYEYLAQKSPTISDARADVYRHSLAVSSEREGYIYTLNVSTLDSKWPQVEAELRDAINSFRLLPPTSSYVPPWKDPWRFW